MTAAETLVVIAPGYEAYRRYHLEALATRYRIHLVTTDPIDWARGLIGGQTIVADYRPQTMLAALRCAGLADAAAGVLAWDEGKIAAAAAVTGELGLPGPSAGAVEAVRDKARTRAVLDRAGVPQPGFALAATLDQARVAADRIGYPVVIKPRGAAASYGVRVVDSAARLDAAVQSALAVRFGLGDVPATSVLVEECIPGPEISVDCAVNEGVLTIVAVARKQLGFPPMCEEVGHIVDAADPLSDDLELHTILSRAHTALGFTHGWTHTELKLTAGGPRLIEVNGRLGGDLIPYLACRATGLDPTLAAAALATGRRPSLHRTVRRVAAVRFLYPPPDTIGATVRAARFDPPGIEGLDLAVALVAAGDTVPPPSDGLPERVGFVVAVGDTVAGCTDSLDAAERAFSLDVDTPADVQGVHRARLRT